MANLSAALRTSRANAVNTAIGAGAQIEFRTGTMPATPETAASGTLLGTCVGGSPFGVVSGNTLTANAITQDAEADASGTAGYVRIKTSGGTAVMDLTVGTSGAEVIMNSTAVIAGGPIVFNSLTISEAV